MRLFIWRVTVVIGLALVVTEQASAIGNKAVPETLQTVLMMSDTHFNPFHDPAKVKQLAEAPAGKWEEILASPDSPTHAQDFETLRMGCKLRGIDTPYSLFASAIQAIHRDGAEARFITISGDMLAHSFGCMFTMTQPNATPEQYMVFTAKTIEYEVLQLRHAVPGAPLYFALGNNDSECGDYRLDTATDWFRTLAKVAEDGVGHTWDRAATDSFQQGGYYSVEMPHPLKKTRMIVVNDMYLAGGYRSCKGEVNGVPGKSQMSWLQTQLDDARTHHERVWVIAHIPPGVSPYATFQQQKNKMDMCKPDGKPASFMPSDILGDTIARYGDVVKLSIFGHTHVDEMKVLDGENGGVPVKNVSSLTAIGGNYPSFTIAQMSIATGELLDYTVVSSPDPQGSNWAKEYTFSEEYGRKGFTPETLRAVVALLAADPGGTTKLSEDYILHWSVGAQRTQLQPIWPGYVCGMNHPHAKEYKACVCSSSLGPSLGGAMP
jgi:sphingomyelin phosphodiesterase acid-like 3